MNKQQYIHETFKHLDHIEANVLQTGFLMKMDILSLIELCRNTIKVYGKTNQIDIIQTNEKEFQGLLYDMCKTKYPELSDLWFIIDEQNNQTQVEVKYKNSISDE